MPVIRLELQGMTETILHAFNDRHLQVSTELQAALDRYLDPKNIQAVINGIVSKEVDAAITEAVSGYFRYGKGRQAIKDAVVKRLDEDAAWHTG